MKLDDTGAAFFVEDVDEEDENSLLLSEITSPLPNRMGHYFDKIKEKSDTEPEKTELTLEEEVDQKRNVRKKRKKRRELRLTRSGSKVSGDDMFDMDDLNDADSEDDDVDQTSDIVIKSISELIEETEGFAPSHLEEPARVSISSGYYSEPETSEVKTGEMRSGAVQQMSQSVEKDLFSLNQPGSPIHVVASSQPTLENLAVEEGCNEDVGIWRWGELPQHQEDTARTGEGSKSWFSWSQKSQPREETVGVYLEEVAADPHLMATYIGNFTPGQTDPLAERLDSGYDEKMENKTNINEADTLAEDSHEGKDLPLKDSQWNGDHSVEPLADLAISLCGGKTSEPADPVTPAMFLSQELTHEQFVEKIRENQNFLSEKEVLVRLNEKYVSWETAAPILMRYELQSNHRHTIRTVQQYHLFNLMRLSEREKSQ